MLRSRAVRRGNSPRVRLFDPFLVQCSRQGERGRAGRMCACSAVEMHRLGARAGVWAPLPPALWHCEPWPGMGFRCSGPVAPPEVRTGFSRFEGVALQRSLGHVGLPDPPQRNPSPAPIRCATTAREARQPASISTAPTYNIKRDSLLALPAPCTEFRCALFCAG